MNVPSSIHTKDISQICLPSWIVKFPLSEEVREKIIDKTHLQDQQYDQITICNQCSLERQKDLWAMINM